MAAAVTTDAGGRHSEVRPAPTSKNSAAKSQPITSAEVRSPPATPASGALSAVVSAAPSTEANIIAPITRPCREGATLSAAA